MLTWRNTKWYLAKWQVGEMASSGITPQVRKKLVKALLKGHVTPAEVAAWAMVSKEAVRLWITARGFDPRQKRARYAQRYLDELISPGLKPGVTERRGDAEEAKSAWDWKQGAPTETP